MAYGQFSGVSREQLKQVFSDALRWQLQRIEQDQAGSLEAVMDLKAGLIHPLLDEYLPQAVSV